MELIQELRDRAARGEDLPFGDLLEVVSEFERLDAELTRTKSRLEQKSTQVTLMLSINNLALESSAGCRTIADIRGEVLNDIKRDTHLYNAFEVRQCIHALDLSENRYEALRKDYDRLSGYVNVPIGVTSVIAAVEAGDVRAFAFEDVAALLEAQRAASTLARPVKNNVREIFQLLKAQPNALFYGEEVRAVRKWGTDHDRNLSIVKTRLGRAFTDPVGYMDPRFDMMLSKTTKRALLDGKALQAHAYQHAVFARPDFLKIPENWVLHDGKTQFHAGEHFHTRATDGLWWCGTHFNDLTGHQLMNVLETALGELRLLHIHFPNGVINEEQN